ncbi:MAG: DUF4403 family protein [Bacteroidota bacterium]|nr:DUF4403 family protein [Bacteroidota bacterium]
MSAEDTINANKTVGAGIQVRIEEDWINKFLAERFETIRINEQYQLKNVQVHLSPGLLNILGDIIGKEGTFAVEVTPSWDPDVQQLKIENLQLSTKSKNLFLKSAGWFAQNFLNSRLDAKIEEQANKQYAIQVNKLKSTPLNFPIPIGGTAQINLADITIHEITLIEKAVIITGMIDATLNVELK